MFFIRWNENAWFRPFLNHDNTKTHLYVQPNIDICFSVTVIRRYLPLQCLSSSQL